MTLSIYGYVKTKEKGQPFERVFSEEKDPRGLW
jgi:hypothetical protein